MKDEKWYGNREGLVIGLAASLIFSMKFGPEDMSQFGDHPRVLLNSIGFWFGTLIIPGTLALLISIISYFKNFGKIFGILSVLFFALAFIGYSLLNSPENY
jgi:hypothetical protein